MRAGVSSACLYPMETKKSLLTLAELGVKNAEIFVNTFSETKTEYVKELREIARANGMSISSIHPYTCAMEGMYFFSSYESRFLDGIELYKSYFNMASELGAEIFVLHGAPRMARFEDEFYFEHFDRLRREAKSFGVTLAQENVERCKGGSLEFLLRMKEEIPELKIVLDVKQAVRAGKNPFDFLNALGDSVCHIHLSDNSSSCECLPLGRGSFDLRGFLARANEVSNAKSVIIELYRDNFKRIFELGENYSYLNSILKEI